ncbi:hypothetical protein AVEN_204695-1 [Araneus ventricosus]|uniref:Uncharacterized protein n=1 Tax=Araneus ventricosus TaxID=182803 RepID=A0A4Y2GGH2_ARAVE|nr:hypothetical protein AVEN_204695-1 [Araneus ventricosus]
MLTLSMRERPKRLFKQKTAAVRNDRTTLRNFHPLSLSVIFSHLFRVLSLIECLAQIGWGKRGIFLEPGQCQLSMQFLRRGGEFLLSLKEELECYRILRFLYSNGLRNQRVKDLAVPASFCHLNRSIELRPHTRLAVTIMATERLNALLAQDIVRYFHNVVRYSECRTIS